MIPRKLVTMIEEYNRIEKQKAKIAGICYAAFMNGKDPDEFLGGKEERRVTQQQMNKAAEGFF